MTKTVRIPIGLFDAATKLAEERHLSLAMLVTVVVSDYVRTQATEEANRILDREERALRLQPKVSATEIKIKAAAEAKLQAQRNAALAAAQRAEQEERMEARRLVTERKLEEQRAWNDLQRQLAPKTTTADLLAMLD